MRVLIVDDSEDIRDVAEVLLRDAGYKSVSSAGSAAEAFEALKLGAAPKDPPAIDLMLLDVIMPEIDGIEACARIRNDPRYADMPIIMVTSLSDSDTLANAFIAGATDYITKPVVRVELLARVRAALKLKSELDRRKAREQELLKRISHAGEGRDYLIDDTTGLLVGEVAESYLKAAALSGPDDVTVLALVVDRIAAYRSTQGDAVADCILGQVARAVRGTAAAVGVIPSAYRNNLIVLIAPGMRAKPARELAEALRAAVSRLALQNAEAIASDHVTVSVAAITGRAEPGSDLTPLLTRAIFVVKEVAAVGGDRVAAAEI